VSFRRYPGGETQTYYTDILITILAHPLRGFTRRRMHPWSYYASRNHRGHCNLSTRISQLWYICRWTII